MVMIQKEKGASIKPANMAQFHALDICQNDTNLCQNS